MSRENKITFEDKLCILKEYDKRKEMIRNAYRIGEITREERDKYLEKEDEKLDNYYGL